MNSLRDSVWTVSYGKERPRFGSQQIKDEPEIGGGQVVFAVTCECEWCAVEKKHPSCASFVKSGV